MRQNSSHWPSRLGLHDHQRPHMNHEQPSEDAIGRAARFIEQSEGIIIAAGAGMGVDSGLPDFRGNAGFWKAYPALGRQRKDFAQIASPHTFASDPELAWGFYGHRLALYRGTDPHKGFEIVRKWCARAIHGGFVFTSNIDGHFQRAGFGETIATEAGQPSGVVECHGSIHWLQCMRPCSQAIWSAEQVVPVVDEAACRWLGSLPSCPRCGRLARPNVLMFDDYRWLHHRAGQQRARLDTWLQKIGSAARIVVIELGAGTHIPTVRHFSDRLLSHGASLVRINPTDPGVPRSRAGASSTRAERAVGLRSPALATLVEIDARLG